MGATRNTGYLENLIAYDASNNVAIATTAIDNAFKITMGGSVKMTGALSGTSATFSGTITSNVTSGGVLAAYNATTGTLYSYFSNTSGNLFYGVESSAGGAIFPGTSAYDAVLGTSVAKNLSFATNNSIKLTIASTGAATFSSSVSATSLALNGSIANSGDAGTLTIKQSSTTYTNGIYLERGGERNGYYMYIGGSVDSLTFRRNYFGTQSDVMSLTRDGNVGIGTASPYSLLQVTSGTAMTTTGGDQASNATIEGANVAIGANFTSQLAVLSNSAIAADIGGGIVFGSKYSGNAFAYYAAIKTGKDDATSGNYGGYLQFATRANGGNVTERMRITSGGNIQISSDSAYGSGGGQLQINKDASSTPPTLTLFGWNNLSVDQAAGVINFSLQTTGTAGQVASSIRGLSADLGESSGHLAFYTTSNTSTPAGSAGTERMRITSGGQVLIGTTSTTGLATGSSSNPGVGIGPGASSFQVNNNSNIYLSKASGYTSGDFTAHFVNGTYVGGISTNGSTTTYATASDYRLKDDFRDFCGLDKLSKIKVYDFLWKETSIRDNGVIAHELAEIFPLAVTGEKDGDRMQGVDYSKLTPILVKSIQEMSAQIEELKSKLS